MVKNYCFRCGKKVYDDYFPGRIIRFHPTNMTERAVLVCQPCFEKFIKWIYNEPQFESVKDEQQAERGEEDAE